ncbi:TPA: hypothetical protein RRH83_002398 [Klebsiella pneumoniae]|nr:hypothetical protein [Klebsiella pneumoniae]
MNHAIVIEGVVFENPTREKVLETLPDYDVSEIDNILAELQRSTDASEQNTFNILEAWKEQKRAEINSWRDAQFILPVTFTYDGKAYLSSMDNVSILKCYQDYLPDGTIWTAEDDSDLLLNARVVSELLNLMQASLSETYSRIHAEARDKKSLVESATDIIGEE